MRDWSKSADPSRPVMPRPQLTPTGQHRPRLGRCLHWFADPVVRVALAGPAHGLLSDKVLTLTYVGGRTGTLRSIPLQYARADRVLVLVAAHSARKSWWRNLQEPKEVVVRVAGEQLSATAEVVRDPALRATLLAIWCTRFRTFPACLGHPVVVALRLADDRIITLSHPRAPSDAIDLDADIPKRLTGDGSAGEGLRT